MGDLFRVLDELADSLMTWIALLLKYALIGAFIGAMAALFVSQFDNFVNGPGWIAHDLEGLWKWMTT